MRDRWIDPCWWCRQEVHPDLWELRDSPCEGAPSQCRSGEGRVDRAQLAVSSGGASRPFGSCRTRHAESLPHNASPIRRSPQKELRPPEYVPLVGAASSEPPVARNHATFQSLPRPAGKSLRARSQPPMTQGGQLWGGWARAKLQPIPAQVQGLQTHHHPSIQRFPGYPLWPAWTGCLSPTAMPAVHVHRVPCPP